MSELWIQKCLKGRCRGLILRYYRGILAVVNTSGLIFWIIAPFVLIGTYQRLGVTYCTDYGDSTFLRNITVHKGVTTQRNKSRDSRTCLQKRRRTDTILHIYKDQKWHVTLHNFVHDEYTLCSSSLCKCLSFLSRKSLTPWPITFVT
jgi:hypothetical protein